MNKDRKYYYFQPSWGWVKAKVSVHKPQGKSVLFPHTIFENGLEKIPEKIFRLAELTLFNKQSARVKFAVIRYE